MNLSSDAFKRIRGKNVYFKAISKSDYKEIHSYASDPLVARYIGWNLMKNETETKAHVEEMLKKDASGSNYYASVVLKKTNKIIGTVTLFNFDHTANHCEIGYVFHRDYWGQGLGSEVIDIVTEFGFRTMNLHRIHGCVFSTNTGSAKVLEKNGYSLEGVLRDYYFLEGEYYDCFYFGKINPKDLQ